ncbi:MAG: MotA/TolQ/ExbB proton channel family protein, partial [Deltaproteobacteria bacterium]|nr:MotA/TolQ/ExbB proton channel family protein [Deltaproteobacteria bacterium]
MNETLAVTSTDLGRHFHGNVLSMILDSGDSGPMVQFVLLLLLFFSVVSWAIILMKYRIIKRSRRENDMFLDRYMKINKLSEVFPESKKFRYSQIAEVFRAGYTELVKVAGIRREALSDADSEISLEMRGLDNVERALNRACDSETTKLESSLGFLATTGSSCPFIGLFGTVWGI